MIKPWWKWGYWLSPLNYGQRAISVNEFLATRWSEVHHACKLNFIFLHCNFLHIVYRRFMELWKLSISDFGFRERHSWSNYTEDI